MQDILEQRLRAARAAIEAAANKSTREFWVAFDEIEAYTLDSLEGADRDRAIETLHAYLGKLRGCGGPDQR